MTAQVLLLGIPIEPRCAHLLDLDRIKELFRIAVQTVKERDTTFGQSLMVVRTISSTDTPSIRRRVDGG